MTEVLEIVGQKTLDNMVGRETEVFIEGRNENLWVELTMIDYPRVALTFRPSLLSVSGETFGHSTHASPATTTVVDEGETVHFERASLQHWMIKEMDQGPDELQVTLVDES